MPVAASVIRAYCQLVLGKAVTGSEISCFLRLIKASITGCGSGPPLYLESFRLGCYHGEILDVGPEEVAQSHERTDCFDVGRSFGSLYCFEFVLAWFDSIRS